MSVAETVLNEGGISLDLILVIATGSLNKLLKGQHTHFGGRGKPRESSLMGKEEDISAGTVAL